MAGQPVGSREGRGATPGYESLARTAGLALRRGRQVFPQLVGLPKSVLLTRLALTFWYLVHCVRESPSQ